MAVGEIFKTCWKYVGDQYAKQYLLARAQLQRHHTLQIGAMPRWYRTQTRNESWNRRLEQLGDSAGRQRLHVHMLSAVCMAIGASACGVTSKRHGNGLVATSSRPFAWGVALADTGDRCNAAAFGRVAGGGGRGGSQLSSRRSAAPIFGQPRHCCGVLEAQISHGMATTAVSAPYARGVARQPQRELHRYRGSNDLVSGKLHCRA
eukprot:COSAG05_NODE_105_length_18793_cov_115.346421_25_plen_205_part_00